jgi:hypothetical protein
VTTYELPNGIGYRPLAEDRMYKGPPLPPEPFTAPRVSASAVKVDGSVVEQAHAAFTNAKTAFEKFLNEIPPRALFSRWPEGADQEVRRYRSRRGCRRRGGQGA